MKTNEKDPKKAKAKPAWPTEEERQASFERGKAEWFKKHGDKLPKVH
ncbi:MAG: hypothetical protein NTV93_06090 [Verrucomicrobia bacterium]|nr:hypothetical protein [Verrucomicrobiota bacterium]